MLCSFSSVPDASGSHTYVFSSVFEEPSGLDAANTDVFEPRSAHSGGTEPVQLFQASSPVQIYSYCNYACVSIYICICISTFC